MPTADLLDSPEYVASGEVQQVHGQGVEVCKKFMYLDTGDAFALLAHQQRIEHFVRPERWRYRGISLPEYFRDPLRERRVLVREAPSQYH
jgi:hypothetical protein